MPLSSPLYSESYWKRRKHLLRARISLAILLSALSLSLMLLSYAESLAVRHLLTQPQGTVSVFLFFLLSALFLFVFCLILGRLALQVSYHVEHSRMIQSGMLLLFMLVYIWVFWSEVDLRSILPLFTSKIYSIFLFFRFWETQLREARLSMRLKAPPRIYLLSWHAFFVSRWVLVACWLLGALGFALSISAVHPVIRFEGWEGFLLMSTFYLLFRAFVRNPNAHAEYS